MMFLVKKVPWEDPLSYVVIAKPVQCVQFKPGDTYGQPLRV